MPNNEQSLLLIHRENYIVPKGQERSVHCKVAKIDSNGGLISKPELKHFGVKAFETYIKSNLELMGYTIEILYHPRGTYSDIMIRDKDSELAAKDKEIARLIKAAEEIAEKDAEIERLKANETQLGEKDKEIARLRKELDKAMKESKK